MIDTAALHGRCILASSESLTHWGLQSLLSKSWGFAHIEEAMLSEQPALVMVLVKDMSKAS